MKKLLFIINPKAGKKKTKDYVERAIAVFNKAGYKVGTKYTRKRADATEFAKTMAGKVDLVVCMGGDGTLNEVIEGMLEEGIDTPLGYIPAGSTNDFATSLGLCSDPEKQAEFIISHEPRYLDMGCFNGRYFVYTASAGIFTRTSYTTSQKLKNRLGHFAYILAGAKEIFHIKKMPLVIETDGEKIVGNYIFAAINNATKVGGIMKIDEHIVKFNDGVFELLLIKSPRGLFSLINTIYKLIKQRFDGSITLMHVKEVTITNCGGIDWSLDGEKEEGKEKVEFKVISNAIRFIY